MKTAVELSSVEERPTTEERERMEESRGAAGGVEVPKSVEEEVDERWIPQPEQDNNPKEGIQL
ncbi:unnamed protein product [Meloidogyne enterolobii]|uniref:Uncharacterized protein n=1 Tax=Meloidogyne enterolobii TaxID=390850 RepID=A0ACB0Y4W1_MELEN